MLSRSQNTFVAQTASCAFTARSFLVLNTILITHSIYFIILDQSFPAVKTIPGDTPVG